MGDEEMIEKGSRRDDEIQLIYAKKLGVRFATLQAAPDGLNIYKRMGFKETCTFRIHSNKRRVLGYEGSST